MLLLQSTDRVRDASFWKLKAHTPSETIHSFVFTFRRFEISFLPLPPCLLVFFVACSIFFRIGRKKKSLVPGADHGLWRRRLEAKQNNRKVCHPQLDAKKEAKLSSLRRRKREGGCCRIGNSKQTANTNIWKEGEWRRVKMLKTVAQRVVRSMRTGSRPDQQWAGREREREREWDAL